MRVDEKAALTVVCSAASTVVAMGPTLVGQ
jgi:hypothetical protein